MQFPSDFIEKYNMLLGDEAEEFFASFDQEAVSAYRTNPLKKQQKEFPDAIPETSMGTLRKNFWKILPIMRPVWSILRNRLPKWSLKWQLQPREVVS